MPDPNETGEKGGKDVKEQARAKVNEEIEKAENSADPAEEKRKLGERLAEELNRLIEEAKEVVENEENAKKGKEAFVKGKEKETVTTKVIQVAQTTQAQAFLEKIAEKIPSPSPSQCNQLAAYLTPYLLGDKNIIINPADKEKSDFQKDFEALASVNPQLAGEVKEALLKTIREGRMPGLTEDQINSGLVVPKEETSQKKQLFPQKVLPEDIDRYNELFKKISQEIEKLFERRLDDIEKIKTLQTFLLSPFATSEDEVLPVIGIINISPEEAKEYFELYSKLYGPNVNLETLKSFAGELAVEIDRAEKEFSRESLMNKGVLTIDEKGRFVLTRQGRLKFRKLIIEFFHKFLSQIHKNRSEYFSQEFQRDNSYHYYHSAIRQIITSSCEDLMRFFKHDPSAQAFLKDKSGRFQASIMNLAQILHDIPLMARTDPKSIEKWAGFFNALFPSQLAEIFDEGEERVMEITRSVITSVLRKKLALNKNYYPNDLYGGQYVKEDVYWHPTLESELEKELRERLDALGIAYEDWEIERALTYGLGIGYLTLIDPETLVTSNPEPANYKGINPILAVLAAKFNWSLGRGEPAVGLISKYLLGTEITLFPEHRGLFSRLWSKKRWVPKEFADDIDRKLKESGEKILDALFDREGAFRELLSIVNFATSLLSRDGWRVKDGFWAGEIKQKFKDFDYQVWRSWGRENWINLYDSLLAEFGATALWWSEKTGPGRVGNELKRLMFAQGIRDDQFSEFLYGEFRTGQRSFERIFDFEDIDGKRRKLSISEIKQKRLYQIRGENFFRYLRRNPGDFFLILTQMAPEILDEDFFLTKGEFVEKYKRKGQPKTIHEIQQFETKKEQFEQRWGEEGVGILKNIRSWLVNQAGGSEEKSIKNFIDKLVKISGHAFENLRNKKGAYLTKQYFDEFGEEGKKIGEAVFGKGGLIKILTGLSDLSDKNLEEFYQNFGDYQSAGKPTIFYRLGQIWSLREGDIDPFSSDVNYYGLFKNVGGVGEDVLGRLTGDAATQYQEFISKLINLDKVLRNVARTGQLEEIYKLHESLFNVVGNIIGIEEAYRANYILAQLVAKFFWEHSLTRDLKMKLILPANLLVRMTMGKELSLSKLLTDNIHAFSMDANAVRSYFLHLSTKLDVLPRKGAWSEEQLNHVFDATTSEFVFGDALPTIGWFIMLFLLFSYIKKAIEEVEGKKK